MEIFDLPVHALVVHAAVVFTPLAIIAAVIFAVVPKWRYLWRWQTVVLAVISFVTIWVAKLSGEDLRDSNFGSLPADNPLMQRINDHESYADVLSWVAVALLLLVVLGAWLLGGPSGLSSGRGAREAAPRYVELVLPLALVVVSVVVLIYVVLTGDAGARAVWGG